MKKAFTFLCLLLLWAGALILSDSFSDPGLLKAPLILIGLMGLLLVFLPKLPASPALLPFLVFWTYGYFRLTRTGEFQAAALMQVGVLFVFLLGFLRAPLAHRKLMPFVILLCIARGLFDLITLTHTTSDAVVLHSTGTLVSAYTMTSFFLDKNLFGGLLILAAFHYFFLMEKGDPQKPVQVILYTSSLLVLVSILLVDSRVVMGVFFICFLPLLFLSLKLDGKEPRLERLAWITGITLSLGIVWINLPEMQLHKMASALANSRSGFSLWSWKAAWQAFETSPIWGSGIGGFRFAAAPFEGLWPDRDGLVLPVLLYAHNHFLQVLAEGGMIALVLELILIGGAIMGFARVYFQAYRLEAKYGFFCLAALLLLGQFSAILEMAPAKFAFWALIGYGWSLLAEKLKLLMPLTSPLSSTAPLPSTSPSASPPYLSPTARKIAGGAFITLACLHLWMRAPQLISDRLFARAQTLTETDRKAYTDLLVESLHANPTNEDATLAYIGVLAEFRREEEALRLARQIQWSAPDARKEADMLARIFITFNQYDSAAKYASILLKGSPRYLPALEILMQANKRQGNCETLDSLRFLINTWGQTYSLPVPADYTMNGLDSLFRSNHEVIFLQRWFGGRALRQRFVESQLSLYNHRIENHKRIQNLEQVRCKPPEKDPTKTKSSEEQKQPRYFLRGWG